MVKYTHTIENHNLDAPNEIVPIIMDIVNPKSVIDVGCGLGTFLKVFKDYGVSRILGLDGSWCVKELLFKNINPACFIEYDLENRILIKDRFDLAISLEVAEHLTPERANSFVEDLTNLADVILFAAAIPGQGGDHHINEKWSGYWTSLFLQYKYSKYDILKPLLWENKKVFFWYKQNMVLFVKNGAENEAITKLGKNLLIDVIHPELYMAFSDYREKNSIKRHMMLLMRAMLYKLGVSK